MQVVDFVLGLTTQYYGPLGGNVAPWADQPFSKTITSSVSLHAQSWKRYQNAACNITENLKELVQRYKAHLIQFSRSSWKWKWHCSGRYRWWTSVLFNICLTFVHVAVYFLFKYVSIYQQEANQLIFIIQASLKYCMHDIILFSYFSLFSSQRNVRIVAEYFTPLF